MHSQLSEMKKLNTKSILLAFGIFVLFGFLLYFPAINYDYVLDDKIVYTENEFTLNGIDGIKDLLSNESFVGYFKEQKDLVQGARYRPLSIITFAIEKSLFGVNSKASHFINILLYGICGWILFLALHKLFPNKAKWWMGVSFMAAILWMAHAIHVEAVASVKGRDEIISLILALITFILSFNYYDHSKKNYTSIIGIFICFFLGLMTKENVVTFLAVIPFSLYFFRQFSWKKALVPIGAMLAALAVYLSIRISVIGYLFSGKEVTDIMNNPYFGLDQVHKFGMITYVLGKYFLLSFVPHPLTHDYYPWQIPKVGFDNIYVLLSLVLHVGLVILALVGLKKKKLYSYLIIFYLSTLSIYSNIVFNVGTTMNDRFLFTSSIATCLAIVLASEWIGLKLNKLWVSFLLVGLVTLAYAVKTIQRVPAWENEFTLNESAIIVSSNSARANMFYATALFKEQQKHDNSTYRKELLRQAYEHAEKSVELHPIYFNGNKMKAGIAAEIYQIDRDEDKLLKEFEEVAAIRPDIPFLQEYHEYLDSRISADKMINYYQNVVQNGLLPKSNYKYSSSLLDRALKLDPNNAKTNYLLYQVYRNTNYTDLANQYRTLALQFDPDIEQKMMNGK